MLHNHSRRIHLRGRLKAFKGRTSRYRNCCVLLVVPTILLLTTFLTHSIWTSHFLPRLYKSFRRSSMDWSELLIMIRSQQRFGPELTSVSVNVISLRRIRDRASKTTESLKQKRFGGLLIHQHFQVLMYK